MTTGTTEPKSLTKMVKLGYAHRFYNAPHVLLDAAFEGKTNWTFTGIPTIVRAEFVEFIKESFEDAIVTAGDGMVNVYWDAPTDDVVKEAILDIGKRLRGLAPPTTDADDQVPATPGTDLEQEIDFAEKFDGFKVSE